MRKIVALLILVSYGTAFAEDANIWLSNIPAYVTGTQIGAKNALDVNVASTSIPVNFPTSAVLPVIIVSPSPFPVTQGTTPWVVNETQVGGANITLGSKSSASSYPVVVASDQGAIPASQSGTWTVQPGNTPNVVPWLQTIYQGGNAATVSASGALKVDASGSTASVTGLVNQGAAGSTSWLVAITSAGNTAVVTGANALKVDNSAVTQPISAVSLPLPAGAATSANQTNGNQVTQITGGGNTATVTAANALKVDASGSTQPISGTVNQGAAGGTSWLVAITSAGNTAVVTSANALKVDGSGVTQPVSMSAANQPINANGNAANSTTIGSSGNTLFNIPAHAVGFVVEAESGNLVNLRYACGTGASTLVGMILEPGRDSGYVPCAATVSVEAVSSSGQAADIQWVLTQ